MPAPLPIRLPHVDDVIHPHLPQVGVELGAAAEHEVRNGHRAALLVVGCVVRQHLDLVGEPLGVAAARLDGVLDQEPMGKLMADVLELLHLLDVVEDRGLRCWRQIEAERGST